MAAASTILTETEVKQLAGMDRHVPACSINDIRQVELKAARDCLGKDFYRAMVADLRDWSEKDEYDGITTYSAGEVVLYQGVYYEALVTTTAEPSLATDWKEADKFATECYNTLFCTVLGRYLALLVAQNSVMPISSPVTAQGIVKLEGEGFKAADKTEVARLQHWYASQVATAFENLDDYLTENSTNACFSSYLGNTNTACTAVSQLNSLCGCTQDTPPDAIVFSSNGTYNFDGYWYNWYGRRYTDSCSCKSCTAKARHHTGRYIIA